MTTQQYDVIEAAARMEYNAVEDVVNVFQFQQYTPTPVTDANTIQDIQDILDTIYGFLTGIITVIQVARDIRITNKTQNYVLGTVSWGSVTGGTATGDALPPGVAGLINFRTTTAKVNPRKYIGGLTEANCAATGLLTVAATTALDNAGAWLAAGGIIATYGSYYYGYFSPKTSNFEVAASYSVTNVPAYQRRRKQGRGS